MVSHKSSRRFRKDSLPRRISKILSLLRSRVDNAGFGDYESPTWGNHRMVCTNPQVIIMCYAWVLAPVRYVHGI
jgi:hypothetical protein